MTLEKAYNSVLNSISKYKGAVSALTSLLLLFTLVSGCIIEDKHSDSDGDGITDYLERTQYHTDPYNSDTDGLSDYYEIIKDGKSDPLKYDTSGDGIDDKTIREEFFLNPREEYPALAYALKKLSKEIVKSSLYALRKANELTPNIKNLIDLLAQYPKELENIVNKKWFRNMVNDGVVTNDEIQRLYDFDGDRIENDKDKNPFNPDRDQDDLLDGKTITLIGNKFPDLCEELMKETIFYRENNDGSITFFGEEDIGTDPDKYDTDGDNKGDGFEEFESYTDPLMKNKTYALLFFVDSNVSEENYHILIKGLNRYGILSQNIDSYLYSEATFENYQKSVKELSKKIIENDHLRILIDIHGTKNGNFKFNDKYIKNTKIIEELLRYNIKAKSISIFINSCHSGMLINELKKMRIDLPLVVYTSTPGNLAEGTNLLNRIMNNSGISYNYDDIDVFSFLDKNYFNNILKSRSNPAYGNDIVGISNKFKQTDENNDNYVSLEEAFKAYCEEMKNLMKNSKYNLDNLSYDPKNLGKILFLGDIYNPDYVK